MDTNSPATPNNFKDRVLEKIRSGQVHMHPRLYFALKAALLVVVTALVVVTSAVLISFILFSVRVSNHLFLLGFGARGWQVFLFLFPWKILVLDFLLVLALGWLLRHFHFGYRSPLLYVLAGAMVVSVAAGLLLNVTPFHRALLHRADRRQLPWFGGLYENLRRPPPPGQGITRGVVTGINGNEFTLQHDDHDTDNDHGTWTVVAPPGLNLGNYLKVGDHVFVAGPSVNGTIRAEGIQKLPPPPPNDAW